MTETKKTTDSGMDIAKEIETIAKLPEAERSSKAKELSARVKADVDALVGKAMTEAKADDAKETAATAEKPKEAPADAHAPEAPAPRQEFTAPGIRALVEPPVAAATISEDSPVAYTLKDIALKVVAPTVAVSATVAAAANSLPFLSSLGLSANPTALAAYTWLQGAVQSIPLIGSWIPTGGGILSTVGATAMIAPVVGTGLWGFGKLSNMFVRLFDKDHPSTGLNPLRNMWYGVKFPFMATKYIAQKSYEKVIDPWIVQPAVAVKDWTAANTGTIAKGTGVGVLVGTALGMATVWPPFGVVTGLGALGAYVVMNAKQSNGHAKKNGNAQAHETTPAAHGHDAPAADHAEAAHHMAA